MVLSRFNHERQPVMQSGESRTQQHFREETNINRLYAKYRNTGVMPTTRKVPMFMDCSGLSFRQVQDHIVQAQQSFAQLPSQIRKRFHNDPAELIEFVADQGNKDEAIRLGLIEPPPPQKPAEPVIPPQQKDS